MQTTYLMEDGIETITMIEDHYKAECKLEEFPDYTLIGELNSNGSVKLLLAIADLVKKRAKGKKIVISIELLNPQLTSLIKVYKRLGFDPIRIIMEKENEERYGIKSNQ
jgi:hypothetical protein